MTKAADTLTDAAINEMDATDVMQFVMRSYMRSQNYAGAVSVARDLAPFQRPKVASMQPNEPLPEDLQPDQAPTPDYDAQTGQGPATPIL